MDLKRITSYLGRTTEVRFEFLLICWSKRHQDFIKEKTFNDELITPLLKYRK
ncbi:MAG: Unknown protein [uncultured Campylobacterales bacterium]|uniref:Uncharacterized protein n=1 Tax=uncultured Campylobacterales bacterium TaxID=352960 RepID=A0A6S6TJU2_9BACT|nr:MAG: Unknown protein [uncultured Campylobacterales bacterium]